jgi:hypothetical protein
VRRRLLRPLVSPWTRRLIALLAFALAFAVRAYWTLRVQSPLTAVYSDMGGYVSRAEALLAGTTPGEPRILLMWPWGTHVIVAGEIALFGRHDPFSIGLVHAFGGALAAPCAALLTARFVRSRMAVLGAGLLVALWHPHVVYSGFFSSEMWFSSALMLLSLLLVRHFEGRWGGLGAGILLAIAFAVRPQILMTCVMFGAVVAFVWFRRRSSRPRQGVLRFVLPLVVPLVLTMGFSIHRFHRLSGQYGLIANNEAPQRLFGETTVGKIDADWVAANGSTWTWWVSPHTKQPVKPQDSIVIHGFVYDTKLLAQVRADRLRGVSRGARLRRMADNVALLVVRNMPWPEDDFRRFQFRDRLQHGFAIASLPLLVFFGLGLFFLERHRIAGLIIGANMATIVIVAALYLGEVRYRVPYDPMIIVVAMVGVHAALRAARQFMGWLRDRYRAPALA